MPRLAQIAELPLPTMIVLGILVVVVAAILLWTSRRDSGASASSHGAPESGLHGERESLETVRRATDQLDAKTAELQRLIADADRAAARLEAALGVAAAARGAAPDAAERLQRLTPPAAGFEETFRLPVSQADALRSTGAVERPLPSGVDGGQRPPLERRYEPIYALADSGLDAAEIARRTGTPLGEVQLILSLRSRS